MRIELPKYDCRYCKTPDAQSTQKRNAGTFTKHVRDFVETLSTHGPASAWAGFTLELSVSAESDSKHYFHEIDTSRDIFPHREDEECSTTEYAAGRAATRFAGDDQKHGWAQGRRTGPSPDTIRLLGYAARPTSSINSLRDEQEIINYTEALGLPTVHVVKRLLIRRQLLRRIEFPALTAIMSSLNGLQDVAIERCRPHDYMINREANIEPVSQHYQDLLRWFRAADSLKSISLFDDHNHLLHGLSFEPSFTDTTMGSIMADETHNLEHFSAAFSIDAADFFQDFIGSHDQRQGAELDLSRSGVHRLLGTHSSMPAGSRQRYVTAMLRPKMPESPDWKGHSRIIGKAMVKELQHLTGPAGEMPIAKYTPSWPRLKTLALTSNDMRPPDPNRAVRLDAGLLAAARAALAMPVLETMEIWSGGKGFACVFRYTREDELSNRPTVSLSDTWGHRLGRDVVAAWEAVARNHSPGADRGLGLFRTPLHPDLFKTHGSVMGLLELKRLVVHPVSLAQLEWEAQNDAWAADT